MKKHFFIYERPIEWMHKKLSKNQFLIFSSALVGFSAGLAAVILKTFVHYIHILLTKNHNIPFQYYLYLAFPLIGILITVWYVKKFRKNRLGRGTANVLYAIAKKSSFLPKDQMYSHILTSGITVGFGGSAGLESPIVTTGAAIGSNFSKTYHIPYKDRTLLLAAGAAAGIGAAFNAPIAGVLFALEVLLMDISISAFTPLIIAAAMGALCSKIILDENILLSFHLQQAFNYSHVHLYIALGLLAGVCSLYYAKTYLGIEKALKPFHEKKYMKAIIAGLALMVIILFFPALFGEGYDTVKELSLLQPEKLFQNSFFYQFVNYPWILLFFILLLIPLKAIAASLTINGGGNGGNFAPSLFVGACLGFVFSNAINLSGITTVSVSNFTIVGMAGSLTGIFYAPLTGIFLIAEITGGYELMIPLMIVSAISYATVRYFEPYSMDIKKMAKKGKILTRDKDKNILSVIKIHALIEKNFQQINPELTLGELVKVIANSTRNIFPVVNESGNLEGIVLLDNIRDIMFRQELYDSTLVKQVMRKPAEIVNIDEDMYSIMKKFDETAAWNLPVLENGKYIGFLSKSNIFTEYRKKLIRSTKE